MRDRIKKVCIVSAAVISGGCAYAAFYRITGIGIPCLFRLITGFKCPGCGRWLRVPRHKGKIHINCRCGYTLYRRT